MPSYDNTAEKILIAEVERGNMRVVEIALASGVSVDGSGELAGMPLMTAVIFGKFSIAKLLIEKGADLEICCQRNGARAVNLAACGGQVDILRLLLRAGANPNSTDENGCTPLMGVCQEDPAPRALPLIVQELMEGGADPARPDNEGSITLHYAASQGHVDVMDMLLSQAPATVNHANLDGVTPLGAAAYSGKDGSVSHLLSAGASDKVAIASLKERGMNNSSYNLTLAITEGHENVVSILLDQGLEAIGGLSVISSALAFALQYRRPRILHRLLNVEGEGRRGHWATCCLGDMCMVHIAAAYAYPTGMSVLLAAGADETTLDSDGLRAWDVVGLSTLDGKRDAVEEMAAVRRALERGPAFRAQSWRWPSRRDTGITAAVTAADVAPLSSRAPRRAPLDVPVFRPRNRKSLVKIIGRYAEKP